MIIIIILSTDLYRRVLTLKSANPQLKVLLAVGGHTAGSADLEAVSTSSVHRQLFADNAVSFLRQRGFDGLDVDWEFPSSSYRTQFTQLLEVRLETSFSVNVLYYRICRGFFFNRNRQNVGSNPPGI